LGRRKDSTAAKYEPGSVQGMYVRQEEPFICTLSRMFYLPRNATLEYLVEIQNTLETLLLFVEPCCWVGLWDSFVMGTTISTALAEDRLHFDLLLARKQIHAWYGHTVSDPIGHLQSNAANAALIFSGTSKFPRTAFRTDSNELT
jgi:hypothetical protein